MIGRAFAEWLAPLRGQPMILPCLALILLVMIGMGSVSPVLSLYAQAFGVGTTLVGMIITGFGLGRLAANLPAGFVAERYGRRALLWGGPLLLSAASVGAALASSFAELLAWRFVQGLGSGAYVTTAVVAIADLSRPQSRGRVMATYQAALFTGSGVGPAIGGWAAELWGMTAPFWVFAAATALAALIAFLTFKETKGLGGAGGGAALPRPSSRAALLAVLRDRSYVLACQATFGQFFTRTGAQWGLMPLLARERFEMSLAAIGAALTAVSIANLVMLPVTGLIVDRVGRKPAIVGATLLSATGLVMVALALSPPLFWAGMVLMGLAAGLGSPAVTAFAADAAPAGLYGPAMGMQRTFGDLGFVLGPLAVGLCVDFGGAGYAGGLLFNALLMAAIGGAFALWGREPPRAAA